MFPINYSIYKGIKGSYGCIQFKLLNPKEETSGDVRQGAVLLEIAPATGPNQYDWPNKILFSLGINDIGQVLMSIMSGEECKLLHDPGAKSDTQGQVRKFFNLSFPQGTKVGGMLSVMQKSGETQKSYQVPISGSELIVLKNLLESSLPKLLNW